MSSIWTVRKLIAWTVPWFEERGISSPRLDAELLLACALHCSRIDLYLNPDKPLSETERLLYKTLIKRRAAREPVAYILGEKEFWRRTFKVDNRVLIPRPETEMLIETALNITKDSSEVMIADLGTGSGCIAVTLAAELPDSRIYATDISIEAIALANENARDLNVDEQIIFCSGSWFNALQSAAKPGSFDMIVSNPPYIATGLLNGLQPEISRFEPSLALDGGREGLDPYIVIVSGAKQWMKKGGYLILEIGCAQGDRISRYLSDASFDSIDIIKDLTGSDRIILARNPQ
ncbi:peptide chain release factor N(5)-glutamine methyltransferase [bacterium]|nr:peptide chain release factor N(5)-glutamine methyltransferase [candidate division CSSED10-310 bacterium]